MERGKTMSTVVCGRQQLHLLVAAEPLRIEPKWRLSPSSQSRRTRRQTRTAARTSASAFIAIGNNTLAGGNLLRNVTKNKKITHFEGSFSGLDVCVCVSDSTKRWLMCQRRPRTNHWRNGDFRLCSMAARLAPIDKPAKRYRAHWSGLFVVLCGSRRTVCLD